MNEFTKEFVKQVRKHLVHVIRFTDTYNLSATMAQIEWLGKEVEVFIIKGNIEIEVDNIPILKLRITDDIHENSRMLNKVMSTLTDILNNKPVIRSEE